MLATHFLAEKWPHPPTGPILFYAGLIGDHGRHYNADGSEVDGGRRVLVHMGGLVIDPLHIGRPCTEAEALERFDLYMGGQYPYDWSFVQDYYADKFSAPSGYCTFRAVQYPDFVATMSAIWPQLQQGMTDLYGLGPIAPRLTRTIDVNTPVAYLCKTAGAALAPWERGTELSPDAARSALSSFFRGRHVGRARDKYEDILINLYASMRMVPMLTVHTAYTQSLKTVAARLMEIADVQDRKQFDVQG